MAPPESFNSALSLYCVRSDNFSYVEGVVVFPLEFQHRSQASSLIAGETRGSSLVVPGNLGFP